MLKQLRRSELVGAALWQEHWRRFDRLRFDADALRWDGFLDLVDERLRAGRILEAGCGPGRYLLYMRRRGAEAVGVDLVPEALALLKHSDPGAPVGVADLAKLPFPDETFATILCLGVLEHFEGGAAPVIEELVRALSPDGLLIVTVPYANAIKRWQARRAGTNVVRAADDAPAGWRFYQYCYQRKEIRALLERAGLTVVHERRTGVLFTFASAFSVRVKRGTEAPTGGLAQRPPTSPPRFRRVLKRLAKEAAYRAQPWLPETVFAHMALAVGRKGGPQNTKRTRAVSRKPGGSHLTLLTRALRSRLSAQLMRLRVSSRWAPLRGGVLSRRVYASYDAYLRHQKAKLERIDLTNYDREYRRVLRDRMRQLDDIGSGTAVLCLAARIGTEVKAFADLGCFAVGVDLNPGAANPYVLHGDFHSLQFADHSVDVVFTNSLDHCFDIDRVLAEVRRVLKPGGRFVVEAVRGAAEGCVPLFYESFSWATLDDLVGLIAAKGFVPVARSAFEYPWSGEQLCFRSRGARTGAVNS